MSFILSRDINIYLRNKNPMFKLNKSKVIIRLFCTNKNNQDVSKRNKIVKVFARIKEKLLNLYNYMLLKLIIIKKCREMWYDKITLKLLSIPVAENRVIVYHRILFEYCYKCIIIEKYISVITLSAIIMMVCYYLGETSYLIIYYLLLGAVEFSTLAMVGFYKRNTYLFSKYFYQDNQLYLRELIIEKPLNKGIQFFLIVLLIGFGGRLLNIPRIIIFIVIMGVSRIFQDYNAQFEREERQKDREAGKFKEEEKKKE